MKKKKVINKFDISKLYPDLIYFIKVDMSDNNKSHFTETITKDFKLIDKKTPIIILNYNTKKKNYIFKKEFKSENIQNFIKQFFKGELNENDETKDKEKNTKTDL